LVFIIDLAELSLASYQTAPPRYLLIYPYFYFGQCTALRMRRKIRIIVRGNMLGWLIWLSSSLEIKEYITKAITNARVADMVV